MAVDADNITVAGTGSVYLGPVGTTGPTDIATALDAAFLDLGYTSEDGVTLTPGHDINEIRAWQSKYPVRRVVTGRSLDIEFTALEWTQAAVEAAFGGGSWATATGVHTYTPPDSDDALYERALVVEWADGTKVTRLHVPKVMVSDVGDITFVGEDAAGFPLTLSTMATDGTAPFTLITNDPAMAA